MQTQYVATRCSSKSLFAAFPSQGGGILPSAYREILKSGIIRLCASVGARISYERQDGENTPPMSEQINRSKECQRLSKHFVHLASLSQCQPAAATKPPMTNMLWLSKRRSRLSQPTRANTNKSVAGRVMRPALLHMLHGGFTLIEEGTPC